MIPTRILIVDDDSENRDILKLRLEKAGYQVLEAENGEEGLRAANEQVPDLIILDVMMPKKDGWQVCKSLKSSQKTKDIPVIVLTARAQPIDQMLSIECGADEYASKPVDHPVLISSIQRLLTREDGI